MWCSLLLTPALEQRSLHSAFKWLTLPPYWKISVATRPIKTLGVAQLVKLFLYSDCGNHCRHKEADHTVYKGVLISP